MAEYVVVCPEVPATVAAVRAVQIAGGETFGAGAQSANSLHAWGLPSSQLAENTLLDLASISDVTVYVDDPQWKAHSGWIDIVNDG